MDPKTLDALAQMLLGAQELCPSLVLAILKAQLMCSAMCATQGVCKLITPADILSLTGRRAPERVQAEELLKKARKVMEKVEDKLSTRAEKHILNSTDVRTARLAVSRAIREFPSFEAGARGVCAQSFEKPLNKPSAAGH